MCVCVRTLSCFVASSVTSNSATLWTVAPQGIKPTSLMSPTLAGRFFATSTTWKAHCNNKEKRKDLCSNDS